MAFFNKKVEKASKAGKLNEGQYKFKPWMANLIMGIIELALVIGWLIGGVITGVKSMMTMDGEAVAKWDVGTTIVLIIIYLIWNILVWCIKPLRTRFNYKATFWNIIFIIWLIVSAIITQVQ